MPNPTSPRVCQLPKGAGARLAGLNKLFFGDLILVNQLKRGPMVLPTEAYSIFFIALLHNFDFDALQ
jgi:hypothetical protein